MTCPDPHWIIGAVLFFIFLGPPVAIAARMIWEILRGET